MTTPTVCGDLLAHSDIVFASDDEARLLAPGLDPSDTAGLAHAISLRGPAEVLVTLGAEGVTAEIDGQMHALAAERIVPVDTVGAGDAFAAGYLSRRLAGAPADERLRVATRCGARACLNPGDWQGAARPGDISTDARDGVIR